MHDYFDIQRLINEGSPANKDLSFLPHISMALKCLIERLVFEQRELFAKLTTSIRQNCFELARAHTDHMLPATAWAARNLLELMVWVRYCCGSEENAVRFQQDALRDWTDFVQASKELSRVLCKQENDRHESLIAQLREAGKIRFAIDDVQSSFLAVSKAAEAMGKDLCLFFKKTNKILSKFAHPTAGLIDLVENDDLILNFTHQGTLFAFDAATTLLNSLIQSGARLAD